jgi:hypothetical protein
MALITSDVLGWWDCQEGTGSTTADKSSGAHNATLAASATWTTGGPTNLPNGINFAADGVNSKVTVPFDYDLSAGAAGVWFKATTLSTSVIVGNGGVGGEFDIFIETSTLKSRTRYTSDRTIVSSTTPSTGTVYFVLYNFASGAMELFLNASSVGTNTNTGTISDTNDQFGWGQRLNGGDLLYSGKIFGVMLFNRVLTGAEITALYNSGAGQTYAQAFPAAPATYRRRALLGVGL